MGASRSARYPSLESRMRRRADYRRCYERGRRRHGSFLTLHVAKNDFDIPRLGITVTRKVGGAVVRNRLKRRLREIYRGWIKRPQLPPLDIVLHVKPSAARASFSALMLDAEELLSSLISSRSDG